MAETTVGIRIADMERLKALVDELIAAVGAFDAAELESLPPEIRDGLGALRNAAENYAEPPTWGAVIIEWPAPPKPDRILPGWGCKIFDAESGEQVTTVTELLVPAGCVTARPERFITADLTMFADDDGKPVPCGCAVPLDENGKIRTGTFRFLVAEMRVGSS